MARCVGKKVTVPKKATTTLDPFFFDCTFNNRTLNLKGDKPVQLPHNKQTNEQTNNAHRRQLSYFESAMKRLDITRLSIKAIA